MSWIQENYIVGFYTPYIWVAWPFIWSWFGILHTPTLKYSKLVCLAWLEPYTVGFYILHFTFTMAWANCADKPQKFKIIK